MRLNLLNFDVGFLGRITVEVHPRSQFSQQWRGKIYQSLHVVIELSNFFHIGFCSAISSVRFFKFLFVSLYVTSFTVKFLFLNRF